MPGMREQLEKMNPGEIYWRRLEPHCDKIDIYRSPRIFIETFGLAPDIERTLFAVHFCQSEVRNGGLHQFFSNPTGVLAPEAGDGFDRIGLPNAGAILREAMAFFGTPYPRERERRKGVLESLKGKTRKDWDPFFTLDDRFFEILDGDGYCFEIKADHFAVTG